MRIKIKQALKYCADWLIAWPVESWSQIKISNPQPVEQLLSLYKILFGIWLLCNRGVFESDPVVWLALSSIMCQWKFGLLFLLVGANQFHASVVVKTLPYRRAANFVSLVLFGGIALAYAGEYMYHPIMWHKFPLWFNSGIAAAFFWCNSRLFYLRTQEEKDGLTVSNSAKESAAKELIHANAAAQP